MSNRFDHRTKKQFKKDIKAHSKSELLIAIRICQDIYNKTNIWPELKPTGTDFTGKFIENPKKITIEPDFAIDGFKYEITKSANLCKTFFHEKEEKVKKALSEGNVIVYVNGYDQFEEPNYCCLGYNELKDLTNKSVEEFKGTVEQMFKGFSIGKKVYRYKTSWVKDLSKPLPKLDLEKIPEEYKKLIKQCD